MCIRDSSPGKHLITIQDGGIESLIYLAFLSKITPALQASAKENDINFCVLSKVNNYNRCAQRPAVERDSIRKPFCRREYVKHCLKNELSIEWWSEMGRKKIEVQWLIDNDDVHTAFHLQSIWILFLTGYKAFPGRSISWKKWESLWRYKAACDLYKIIINKILLLKCLYSFGITPSCAKGLNLCFGFCLKKILSKIFRFTDTLSARVCSWVCLSHWNFTDVMSCGWKISGVYIYI